MRKTINKRGLNWIILLCCAMLPVNVFLYYNVSYILAGSLFCLVAIVLLLLFKKKYNFFINMPGVFSFIWFFTIGLSNFRLHWMQTEWKINTWVCLLGTYYMFLIGCMIVNYFNKRRQKDKPSIVKEKKISKKEFTAFYLVLSLIPIVSLSLEILLNDGMMPVFSDEMSSYQDFSTGLLHYFTVSSCLIPAAAYIFIRKYKTTKFEKSIIILLAITNLFIPLIIVSRQLSIVAILFLALTICFYERKNEKRIIFLAIILLFAGWFFIGNFRNQDDVYLKSALSIQDDAPLSVSNMQTYMYIAMNYDNFNLNVDEYTDYKNGVNSVYPLFGLTRIKQFMPSELFEIELKRIISVFNTYAMPMKPYTDGGVVAVLLYALVIGIICRIAELSKKNKVHNFFIYNILFVSLIFSFFGCWFSGTTWWFYIVYIFVLSKLFFGRRCLAEEPR